MPRAYLVSVLTSLVLAVMISGQPTPARAANPGQWAYDPSQCLQNARGKRYIAIGTTVLALDPDPTFVDGPAIELDEPKRLTPPNPDDRLGCPDNPNQVLIALPPRAILPDLSEICQVLGIQLHNFGLAPMHGVGVSALDGRPIIPEQPSTYRDNPRSTDDLCNRPHASVSEKGGIRTCRWPSHYLEPGTAYVVDPKVYATPAGDPFRVLCGVQAYDGHLTPCYVYSYATNTGLAIGYAFFPLVPIRTPDLAQKVITFDRQIRDALSRAVVSNYPWPTKP